MKNTNFWWFAAVCILTLFARPLLASTTEGQEYPSNVGVYVWAEAKSISAGVALSYTAQSEVLTHLYDSTFHVTHLNLTGTASSNDEWVRNGQREWLSIRTNQHVCYHSMTGSNVSRYRFHVVAPTDYAVYFYDKTLGYYREAAVFESDLSIDYVLFIVKPRSEKGALAGKVVDVAPTDTKIRLGLGFLPNGDAAGYLDFSRALDVGGVDSEEGYKWLNYFGILPGNFYKTDLPGRLFGVFKCFPTSDLVKLVTVKPLGSNAYGLRQVMTPQTFVNIESRADNTYHKVSFYNPSQATPDGSGGYTPSGSPYVTYEISISWSDDYWLYTVSYVRTEGETVSEASVTTTQEHETVYYDTGQCTSWGGYFKTIWIETCTTDVEIDGIYEDECTGYTIVYYHTETNCDTDSDEVWVDTGCDQYAQESREVGLGIINTTVNGFSGFRTEQSVSGQAGTSGYNGDNYNAVRTGSSFTVTGRYSPSYVHNLQSFTSTLENVIERQSDAGFEFLDPDIANGGFGYTTRRRYYDFFQFDTSDYLYPGRLFYEDSPDRSWTVYGYYSDLDRIGLTRRTLTPFGDTNRPSSVDADTQSGYRAQTIDYAADWDGAFRLPSRIESWALGSQLAVTTYEYSALASVNGQPVWQTVSHDQSKATNQTITRTTKVYQGASVNSLYRNQPFSIEEADGTKQSYAYERGTIDDQGAFVYDSLGGALRVTVVSGNNSGGTTTLSGCNQAIDAIGLVSGVSTKDVTIRNERAFTIRTEKHVYNGSGWVLLSWQAMTYNVAGNLIRRETSTGAIYEAEYTNSNNGADDYGSISLANGGTATGRKQYERDERGVITKYSYDGLGRVSQTLQLAIPSSSNNPRGIPALRTRFTYDNDNRVLEKRVGEDGAEQYVTSYQYDFSGRMTKQTENGIPTQWIYTLSNGEIQSVRETRVDNTYVDTVTNRDGTVRSKTGNAVVPTYVHYSIDGAQEKTTTYLGSDNSSRWASTWTDGLGRTLTQQSATPADANGSLTITSNYNSKGQLSKTQTSGLAPTLYVYDAMGRLMEQGLALGGGDVLTDSDRRERRVSDYRERDGAWWQYSESYSYPDASSTGVVVNRTWARQTGFSGVSAPACSTLPVVGSAMGETITQDMAGNETRSQIFVQRGEGNLTSVAISPLASQPAITRSVGGVTVKSVSASGVVTTFDVDNLLRVIRVWDRTRTSADGVNFVYDTGKSRIHETYDNRGKLGTRYTYDAAGRVRMEEKPLITYGAPGQPATWDGSSTTKACYAYNLRGQLTHVWGDQLYPIKYVYDGYGDRTTQYTYRSFENWTVEQPELGNDPSFWPSNGDATSFNYYAETGLLHTRKDAKNHTVTYVYNPRGQLTSRAWARGVTTSYVYDPQTGELTDVTYSDGTPALNYGYDRLGRLKRIKDVAGYRTFGYRPADLLLDQESLIDDQGVSNVYGKDLSIRYAYQAMNGAKLVPVGFDLLTSSPAVSSVYNVRLGLDPQTGRLASISTDAGVYNLGYIANSDLLHTINQGSWTQTREYETNRNLLTSISTQGAQGMAARYSYASDDLGRRYQVSQGGQMFTSYVTPGQEVITQYAYDSRSQLTAAVTHAGDPANPSTAPQVPGRNFGFAYDAIGNRTTEAINGENLSYTPNELNQYTQRTTPSTMPVSGTVGTGASVSVNGTPVNSSGWLNQYFYQPVAKSPASGGLQSYSLAAARAGHTNTSTVSTWARPTTEGFSYDDDGNLLSDGLWDYTFDGENRLVSMASRYADEKGSRLAVYYRYDYCGRRIDKAIYDYTGSALAACRSRRLYVHNGWNLIAEYEARPSDGLRLGLVRTCTWGPDLSGSLQGAGGVGGLLAVRDYQKDSTGVYEAAYDGDGNLTALIASADGSLAAGYEYDPYGNAVRASGRYAQENPFRFCTKYYDVETGLSNYGLRYYSASLGRFVNRDPLEERGGWALFKNLCLGSGNSFAGSMAVGGEEATKAWQQKQDALLTNSSLAHAAQAVNVGSRVNTSRPAYARAYEKYNSANATDHNSQGGSNGLELSTVPMTSVGSPGVGSADTNLYCYAGNNPTNSFDAIGLSEIDVHEFLTAFLAQAAGFPKDRAFAMGNATQALDRKGDPRNAMFHGNPIPNCKAMREYHFVSEKRLCDLRSAAFADPTDLKKTGEFFHALEDTYPHSKGKGDRNFEYYGGKGGGLAGHGPHGHNTDFTWSDPAKSLVMAKTVFEEMKNFAKANGSGPSEAKDWNDIEAAIKNFIVADKGDTVGWIAPEITSEGLNDKIQKLDQSYVLTNDEAMDFPKRHHTEPNFNHKKPGAW